MVCQLEIYTQIKVGPGLQTARVPVTQQGSQKLEFIHLY